MTYNSLAGIYINNDTTTRQTGKTTALIEACKKIGGIFVTHSYEEGRSLKKKYPDVNITAPRLIKLLGETRPIIFDHYLLSLILTNKYYPSIDSLSTELLDKILEDVKKELLNRLEIGVNNKTQDI